MKLGDRVRFDRELVKVGARCFLQREELWAEFKHDKPLEGVVCGKRRIARYGELGYDYTLSIEEYQQVCLVATDMRGFHRVPEEWLENVTEETRAVNAMLKKNGWTSEELTEEEGQALCDVMTGKAEEDES